MGNPRDGPRVKPNSYPEDFHDILTLVRGLSLYHNQKDHRIPIPSLTAKILKCEEFPQESPQFILWDKSLKINPCLAIVNSCRYMCLM